MNINFFQIFILFYSIIFGDFKMPLLAKMNKQTYLFN